MGAQGWGVSELSAFLRVRGLQVSLLLPALAVSGIDVHRAGIYRPVLGDAVDAFGGAVLESGADRECGAVGAEMTDRSKLVVLASIGSLDVGDRFRQPRSCRRCGGFRRLRRAAHPIMRLREAEADRSTQGCHRQAKHQHTLLAVPHRTTPSGKRRTK